MIIRWWTDATAKWLTIVVILINLGQWLAGLFFIPSSQSIIPLHYTIYFGIDLTGHKTGLLFLQAAGLIVIISHIVIANWRTNIVWARLWIILALTVNIVAGGALITTILLARGLPS